MVGGNPPAPPPPPELPASAPAQVAATVNMRPSRLEGSFDLFESQLIKYLTRYNAWRIVDGSELLANVTLQTDWHSRDNLAMETPLSGIGATNAEKICIKITSS